MSREAHMIADLVATAQRGLNDAVRQNALDLLYKLAADGLRAAKGAVDLTERTQLAESRDISRRVRTGK